jgi:hypothetical protein
MKNTIFRIAVCSSFLLVVFFSTDTLAAYVEGIDTTDSNGCGLDSAFQLFNGYIGGQNIANYWFSTGTASAGYFNYSFDDIKMAPKFQRENGYPQRGTFLYYCFVIKKNKDSTYSKVQLLQQISGNRYVYRYGTNTTPNDRMLVKPDYNRSIKYKPNNLHNLTWYPIPEDSTTWEPPLPNNNHLLGYIFYRAKSGVVIDTSATINPAQWDSILFFDATCTSSRRCFRHYENIQLLYFNLVAVYSEGKSDFLLGWTKYYYTAVGVKQSLPSINLSRNRVEIIKSTRGFFISYKPLSANIGPLSFSICDISGRQVVQSSNLMGNSIFWNTSQRNLAEGLYIVRAEMPDRNVINQPLMFTR